MSFKLYSFFISYKHFRVLWQMRKTQLHLYNSIETLTNEMHIAFHYHLSKATWNKPSCNTQNKRPDFFVIDMFFILHGRI